MGGSGEPGCFQSTERHYQARLPRRAEDTLGAGLEHKEGSEKLAEEAQEWG